MGRPKLDLVPTSFKLDAKLMRRFRIATVTHGYSMSEIIQLCLEIWLQAIEKAPDKDAIARELAAAISASQISELSDLGALTEAFIRFIIAKDRRDQAIRTLMLDFLRERVAERKQEEKSDGEAV